MPTQPPPIDNHSIFSEFDHHRLTLVSGQEGDGWRAELRQYLKDMPANVTKDTDIVEWWQVRSWLQYAHYHVFLTVYRITDTITPRSAISQSIFLHARHPPSPASGFSPVVARSQRSVALN